MKSEAELLLELEADKNINCGCRRVGHSGELVKSNI